MFYGGGKARGEGWARNISFRQQPTKVEKKKQKLFYYYQYVLKDSLHYVTKQPEYNKMAC